MARDTIAFDRHRLAEIDAQIAGRLYETDDPGWLLGQGMMRGAATDPELLRAGAMISGVLARGVEVLAAPAILAEALEARSLPGLPGLTRAGLVKILTR